jgi:hypothetical protein
MFLRISRTFAVGRLDSLANHGVHNSRLMQRTGAAQAEGDGEAARQPLSVILLDGDDMALPVLKPEQVAR